MNNIKQLQEIQKIVTEHLVRGGNILEYGGKNRDIGASKRAEDCFSEGLTKLKRLKLSPENRRNIRLLRNAFEYAIKSTKALRKGRNEKARAYMDQSSEYGYKYRDAVIARVKGK